MSGKTWAEVVCTSTKFRLENFMCYCFVCLHSLDEKIQTETEKKRDLEFITGRINLLTPAYVNEIMACIRNIF